MLCTEVAERGVLLDPVSGSRKGLCKSQEFMGGYQVWPSSLLMELWVPLMHFWHEIFVRSTILGSAVLDVMQERFLERSWSASL